VFALPLDGSCVGYLQTIKEAKKIQQYSYTLVGESASSYTLVGESASRSLRIFTIEKIEL
jgi:hypothetical protein